MITILDLSFNNISGDISTLIFSPQASPQANSSAGVAPSILEIL